MKKEFTMNTGILMGIVHSEIKFDKERLGWAYIKFIDDEGNWKLGIPFRKLDDFIDYLNKVKNSKEYEYWKNNYVPSK
jgi:hypothetical protein